MTSLKGKVAIITGAGRGIGRAIAVKFAQCVADVALVDLEIPLESAEVVGPSGVPFAADVSSEAAWAKLGEALDERSLGFIISPSNSRTRHIMRWRQTAFGRPGSISCGALRDTRRAITCRLPLRFPTEWSSSSIPR